MRLPRLAVLGITLAAGAAAAGAAADLRNLHDLWLAGQRLFSSFEAPDETRRLLARVIADVRGLDLSRLYEALPDGARADRARLVLFRAEGGETRRVSHAAFHSPLDAGKLFEPAASPEPFATLGPAIGDGWFVGGALPLDAERFRVRVSTALRVGRTDLSRAGAIAVDFLHRLETRLRTGEENAFAKLLADDHPAANAFLGRYVALGGKVAWDGAKDRIRFAPSAAMRREALKADYPLLAGFVVRSSEFVRATGRVADGDGARVASWTFRGLEGIEIETAFRDGRMLPLEGSSEGHALDRPFGLAFDSDASLEAFGLRTTIEGARTTLALEPPAARLATTAAGMPRRTAIDGALFGILTPSALDLMVPGSIDGILQELLRSVLEGREKRGLEAWVRADERNEHGFQLRSDAAVDVSSGRLVRVALAIGARWLYPTDEETEDVKRFVRDLTAQLVKDAESASPSPAPSGRPLPNGERR